MFHLPARNAGEVLVKIDHTEKYINKLAAVHAQFLLNNNKEDNPFVISNNELLKETQSAFIDIKNDIQYIKNRRSFSHKKKLNSSFNDFSVALANYQASLYNLFLITKERGDKQSGVVKQWLDLSRQMALSQSGNTQVIQKISQIKQLESDYLIFRDLKTLENISVAAEELRGMELSDTETEILNSLDLYAALTGNLAGIEKRLGIGSAQGIVPDLEHSMKAIPAIFEQIDQQIRKQAQRIRVFWNIACYAVIILIVSLFIYLFVNVLSLIEPLKQLSSFVRKIATGEFPEEEVAVGNLSDMKAIGELLKQHVASLKDKFHFVQSMNHDVLDTRLTPSGEHDLLGNELMQLQRKINEALIKQVKNEEDNLIRRYMNEGLAKFADILRSQDIDINSLGDAFIQGIVKYLNAIQGGFFVLDNADSTAPVLRLVSAFAYNRKKYLDRTIAFGEGLVGTCAKEKQFINLTEIPDGYITITSGLGDTPPNNLLLVPVLHENELLGVIEIASLLKFKPHEIEFSQQVAFSLGSTMMNTRNNQKTTELLGKSQQQALEMAEQEEEMRQNMEELKATQEESGRREEELRGISEAVNSALMVVSYDLEGKIIDANERLCIFLGRDKEYLLGRFHTEAFGGTLNADSNFWQEIQNNGPRTINETIKVGKKNREILEQFASVLNRNSNTVKYINFVSDGRTGNS